MTHQGPSSRIPHTITAISNPVLAMKKNGLLSPHQNDDADSRGKRRKTRLGGVFFWALRTVLKANLS